MSRPSLRRTPKLELLETRQVLSNVVPVVGPNAGQQYALSLMNLVRTNPAEAAQKLTADLSPDVKATLNHYGLSVSGLISELDSATPQPALAWSDALGNAAQGQSQYEASNGVQTHQGPGQASLDGRINAAGYTNDLTYGENTYAYATSIDEAMQSFLFDWGVSDHGHYNNLLQPGASAEGAYKDAGVGLVDESSNGTGPFVLTQDFGSQANEGPQIVGVVYNDPSKSGTFGYGEGIGGVTIDIKNLATGQDTQTQSFAAGGYQMPVAPNADYQVTATKDGQVLASQTVHVGDVNAEADLASNPTAVAPAAPPVAPPAPVVVPTVSTKVSVSVPVVTPVATPVVTPVATSVPSEPAPSQPSSPVAEPQILIPFQADSASVAPTSAFKVSGWSHWVAGKS